MRSPSRYPWLLASFSLFAACGGVQVSSATPNPAPPVAEANQKPSTGGEFAAYRQTMPGSDVGFDLVPIAGGTFRMGSPADEPGRKDDEGPAIEVRVEPFWMGKCEVTWAEYDLWNTDLTRSQAKKPDGVARPTPPYMDMTFNMGRDGYPAICVSHVAARQYCRWLSDKTGHFYRLPTEAEWEYACRAGTTSAYSCGDPKNLDAVAWYAANSQRALDGDSKPVPAYHKVGEKAANAWGLHDMHGNVAEWVADTYLVDAYAAVHGASPRVRVRPAHSRHVHPGCMGRRCVSAYAASLLPVADSDWHPHTLF